MTLGLALVSAAFPPEKRGAALGLFSAVTGIAVASGPLVGGAIARGHRLGSGSSGSTSRSPSPSSRSSFRRIAESFGPRHRASISPGLALISAARPSAWSGGSCAGNPAGWGSFEVVGALAGRACCWPAAFIACELRARHADAADAVLSLARLLGGQRRRSSSRSPRCSARVFFLAQFLQTGLGYGPLDAGLRLMPWTATLSSPSRPLVGDSGRPLRRAAVHGRRAGPAGARRWAGSR